MPGSTPNMGYPFPVGGDPIRPHEDIEDLAVALDAADFAQQGRLLPVGGTNGQALVKTSAVNYAVAWASVPVVTAWANASLGAGWITVAAPDQVPQYRMIGDVVYLRGITRAPGAGWVGSTILTLPAGFRPPTTWRGVTGGHITTGSGGAYSFRLMLDTSGVLSYRDEQPVPTSNPVVYLDGISFSVTA